MATLNDMFTADSLQNYQTAYKDYMAQGMDKNAAYTKAKEQLVRKDSNTGNSTTTPTSTSTPTSTPTVKQETVVKEEKTPVNTVSEIKQEGALKPQSQDYYNQTGDDAMNKIRNNLNNYRQTNPEYFSNYEDFKKNF